MIMADESGTWRRVDEYLSEQLIGPDAALEACAANSTANGLPEIQVTPLQGQFLFILARAMRASRILEIGTLGGYSTISLARAVVPDGFVLTCELESKHADVARANLAKAGLADVVTIRVGPAMDTLDALIAANEPAFDMIFIDADKVNMPGYFQRSIQLARTGTLMVFDNVVRDGEVANDVSEDPSVIGVRKLMQMLGTDPRIDASALQTVGTKGYDGFAFAIVS